MVRERRCSHRHRCATAQRKPRTADRVHGTQVRERRSSDRHRWAKPSETAYRCLRRIAGTAWNADLRSAPPAAGGRNRASPSCADGAREQNVGIGGDLHSSPAHPAAAASFSSSTERRRVPGSANMPKTLEIGSPGFARSRTWPSGSRSTSTLSPCRAPRCSRTSLRRVIWPSAVTVSVMAMARSPYGRKALWPFPTVQIPLLGGTTGPSRPRRIPDRTPTTRITPGTPASPPGGGVHIGTAARRRSEIASGSSSGITCKVPCPRPRGCAIAPSLDQPTPVIDRTSSNRRPLSTGPHSQPTPVIDRTSSQPTFDIDRTSSSRRPLSTGPPAADPRYRPDPLQPTLDIDRTSRSRPALSTGPPSADARYRPDPLQPTRVIDRTPFSRPDIDRTSRSRPALSTGLLAGFEKVPLLGGQNVPLGFGRTGARRLSKGAPWTDRRAGSRARRCSPERGEVMHEISKRVLFRALWKGGMSKAAISPWDQPSDGDALGGG